MSKKTEKEKTEFEKKQYKAFDMLCKEEMAKLEEEMKNVNIKFSDSFEEK